MFIEPQKIGLLWDLFFPSLLAQKWCHDSNRKLTSVRVRKVQLPNWARKNKQIFYRYLCNSRFQLLKRLQFCGKNRFFFELAVVMKAKHKQIIWTRDSEQLLTRLELCKANATIHGGFQFILVPFGKKNMQISNWNGLWMCHYRTVVWISNRLCTNVSNWMCGYLEMVLYWKKFCVAI